MVLACQAESLASVGGCQAPRSPVAPLACWSQCLLLHWPFPLWCTPSSFGAPPLHRQLMSPYIRCTPPPCMACHLQNVPPPLLSNCCPGHIPVNDDPLVFFPRLMDMMCLLPLTPVDEMSGVKATPLGLVVKVRQWALPSKRTTPAPVTTHGNPQTRGGKEPSMQSTQPQSWGGLPQPQCDVEGVPLLLLGPICT